MPRKVRSILVKDLPDLDTLFKTCQNTVKCVETGNIIQLTTYEKVPEPPPVVKLSQDYYAYTKDIRDCDTHAVIHVKGEVFACHHSESRADDKRSVSRSLKKLRDLINANVTDVANVRWVTLTYAENMTDTVRAYEDFKNFNKRFAYYCRKNKLSVPEYIAAIEPQGRGAWHFHVLYIWDCPAPFIDNNSVFAPMWRQGFTSIKALRGNIDNLGAYLSAYLGDMSLDEFQLLPEGDKIATAHSGCAVMEKDALVNGKRVKKKILKGARLRLYPPGMNIFRCSRGVKRPVETEMSVEDAKRKVGSATPTFRAGFEICDVSEQTGKLVTQNHINRIYYNLKRDVCQEEIQKSPCEVLEVLPRSVDAVASPRPLEGTPETMYCTHADVESVEAVAGRRFGAYPVDDWVYPFVPVYVSPLVPASPDDLSVFGLAPPPADGNGAPQGAPPRNLGG